MKTEFQTWQDELARPKLTITQRVALWFDRPAPEPEAAPEPDPYRWWSVEDLIAAASIPQPK